MEIELTTTGRKTGIARTVTLYAWPDGDTLILVGSWGGRARDPDWAGNLRAQPRATVAKGRESHEMAARELEGQERDRAWEIVVERFPLYATYQRRTTRRIPLFALSRI